MTLTQHKIPLFKDQKYKDYILRVNVTIKTEHEFICFPMAIDLSIQKESISCRMRYLMEQNVKAIFRKAIVLCDAFIAQHYSYKDNICYVTSTSDKVFQDHINGILRTSEIRPVEIMVRLLATSRTLPLPLSTSGGELGIPLGILIDRKNAIECFHLFLADHEYENSTTSSILGEEDATNTIFRGLTVQPPHIKDFQFNIAKEAGIGLGAQRSLFQSYFEQMAERCDLFERENDQALLLPKRNWKIESSPLTSIAVDDLFHFGQMIVLAKHFEVTPLQFHPINFVGLTSNCFEIPTLKLHPLDAKYASFEFPQNAHDWMKHPQYQKWMETYSLDSIACQEEWMTKDIYYDEFQKQAKHRVLVLFRAASLRQIMEGSRSMLHWYIRNEMVNHGRCNIQDYPTMAGDFYTSLSQWNHSVDALYAFIKKIHVESSKPYFDLEFTLAIGTLYERNPTIIHDLVVFIASHAQTEHLTVKTSNASRAGTIGAFLPYSSTCTKTLYVWNGYTSHTELAKALLMAITESGDEMHII